MLNLFEKNSAQIKEASQAREAIRAGSVSRPLISHMNSIQMKEPLDHATRFADLIADQNSPDSKRSASNAFKGNNTEIVFRGDSFNQEDLDQGQTPTVNQNFLQNMVLHLTGTCPTCR